MSEPSDRSSTPFLVRAFRPADRAACRTLYVEGLIAGRIADNDTGFDIDDIESAYMKAPVNGFWVAVAPAAAGSDLLPSWGGAEPVRMPDGEASADPQGWCVVGMIGVQAHDRGLGEIRRLRVARTHRRRGIGSALVEAALRFCERRQYLKITLDTFIDREPAIRLFHKFHFHHERTRKVGDKGLVYFYLDVYATAENDRGAGI